MNQPESAPAARRKFLVVVDDTPECKVALRFAARRAQATGGGVTLLYVMEPAEFQHWMFVGDLMEQESREEAERLLQGLAAEVNDLTSIVPELLVREGRRRDELLALIEEAGTAGERPGRRALGLLQHPHHRGARHPYRRPGRRADVSDAKSRLAGVARAGRISGVRLPRSAPTILGGIGSASPIPPLARHSVATPRKCCTPPFWRLLRAHRALRGKSLTRKWPVVPCER
jgi:hypothetical protein